MSNFRNQRGALVKNLITPRLDIMCFKHCLEGSFCTQNFIWYALQISGVLLAECFLVLGLVLVLVGIILLQNVLLYPSSSFVSVLLVYC